MTAIPRVTAQSGLKVVALVPLIRPAATASSTAWLYQLPAGTSVKAAWAAPAGTASARASVSPHTARSALPLIVPLRLIFSPSPLLHFKGFAFDIFCILTYFVPLFL